MTTGQFPNLDAEELAHLGLAAAAQGRLEEALLYLKAASQQAPDSVQVNYSLGTLYAQLGMAERGAHHLGRVVAKDPDQVLAAFQAGWLLMSVNKSREAQDCWAPLRALEESHPLRLMAMGLQAVVNEDFEVGKRYLTEGIQANQRIEPLNVDMRKILADLERRGLTSPAGAGEPVRPLMGGYGPQ